jgi:hypothetical protein
MGPLQLPMKAAYNLKWAHGTSVFLHFSFGGFGGFSGLFGFFRSLET